MPKYRKKPVVVEAIQFNKGITPDDVRMVLGENPVSFNGNGQWFIQTLEGNMEVKLGDYIIKGIKGEFYPCKPDIFEQTYEPAEDEPSEERWQAAIDNARFMLEQYKKIPTGAYGAILIANEIARYENGERTKELLEALEAIE